MTTKFQICQLRLVLPALANLRTLALAAATALATLTLPQGAAAEEMPARIDFLIGAKPGGGYDRYGRLIAKYMESHLEGVTVVPINKAAAGGVPALREVREDGADGSEIMIFNTGKLLAQLGGEPLALESYRWLGKATSEARVLMVHPDSGIDSFEALQTGSEGLIFVTSSHGSSAHIQTHLIREAWGLEMSIVPGFGGNEAEAALLKGEVDGILVSESNVAAIVEAGLARPLMVFGETTDPLLADVPKGTALAETEAQKMVARAITVMTRIGRPVVAAPDVAPEVLTQLRAAFAAALADPALLAEAAAGGMDLDVLPGEAAEQLARDLLAGSPGLAEMVQVVLAE